MAESDAALVKRVLAGEPECFRTLVERYQDAVYGVALSTTGSFADADDVAQDAFLSAFDSLEQLAKPERLGSWLYSIARNKSLNRVRGDKRRKERQASIRRSGSRLAGPTELAARNETRGHVMAALARLSEVNREAATLYYIDGYSTADIGRFTGRPTGTIKRRLHEARNQLRKELVAMVEDELKQSRPRKEFTDRVLREVSQVRVWLSGEAESVLLLTDSKGRSFWINVSPFVAKELEPWLSGEAPEEDMGIYGASNRALTAFGLGIKEFAFTDRKVEPFGVLKVTVGKRVVEIDCPPQHGINLALRAGAPLLVADEVAAEHVMKRKDGKPLTPQGAWRRAKREMEEHFRNVKTVRFRDMAEVIRVLEKDVEAREARWALPEAADGFRWTPPRLKDDTDAMATLKSWVDRCKGTDREGFAAGLLGSVHVWPLRDPEGAIPYLETAVRLTPDDGKAAFELATCYAMAGRADEAFALFKSGAVQGKGVPEATACGNFFKLWEDPRFRELFGEPDPRCAKILQVPLLRIIATVGVSPLGKEPRVSSYAPGGIASGQTRQLSGRLQCGPLQRVASVEIVRRKRSSPSRRSGRPRATTLRLVLEVQKNRGAVLELDEHGSHLMRTIQWHSSVRHPEAPHVVCHILKEAHIELVAAVLLKQRRSILGAALVLSKNEQQAVVPLSGGAAIAVALAAEGPLLIADELAEKLYVRGKNGRPLTPGGVRRRLLSAVE